MLPEPAFSAGILVTGHFDRPPVEPWLLQIACQGLRGEPVRPGRRYFLSFELNRRFQKDFFCGCCSSFPPWGCMPGA